MSLGDLPPLKIGDALYRAVDSITGRGIGEASVTIAIDKRDIVEVTPGGWKTVPPSLVGKYNQLKDSQSVSELKDSTGYLWISFRTKKFKFSEEAAIEDLRRRRRAHWNFAYGRLSDVQKRRDAVTSLASLVAMKGRAGLDLRGLDDWVVHDFKSSRTRPMHRDGNRLFVPFRAYVSNERLFFPEDLPDEDKKAGSLASLYRAIEVLRRASAQADNLQNNALRRGTRNTLTRDVRVEVSLHEVEALRKNLQQVLNELEKP